MYSKTKHNIRHNNQNKHQQRAINAVIFNTSLDLIQSQATAQ